ncbi:MAG: amino acid adenylation domain-containing protein, partial [Planctomycetes bacterium]|nr:amino acid adenylation domain-containing protein [Planctomycetota bacterium]
RGYHRDLDLTAKHFVANPFGPPATRLYRTGDLGRYRVDGTIEFRGRRDSQIKICGHRVELSEIQNVLNRHPTIGSCIVTASQVDGNEKRLVGYVVPSQDSITISGMVQKGARVVVRSTLRTVPTMTPEPFLNLTQFLNCDIFLDSTFRST